MTVLVVGSCFVLSGFSTESIEYRRVRIHQISLSAIELLTDPHPTKYCLTVDRLLDLLQK
ncbi:hypothetical protein [Microcoleus sp. N9_A1]|uniref:hypothetical protein n=1 Tax=Microcoleus sp. N9_A1 TaxID=3055380 RepID=UPI002FD09833